MKANRCETAWIGLGIVLFAAAGGTAAEPAGDAALQVMNSGPIPYLPLAPQEELSAERRHEIESMLDANVARLRAEGKLPPPTEGSVLLSLPLQPAPGLGVEEPWGIYYYVDQNLSYPDQILDYNCGARTYDLADGYNHGGTDFTTWPWPWKQVAEDGVHIIAAAPGTIIGKDDGYPDQSCDWNGQPFWNAVYVMHADGSIAWYGHMKKFSQTTKAVGEPIARGEFLGIVGSSGRSSAPHLHFEVHDASDAVNDPFAGTCSILNPSSWWISQGPYDDSKVLRMTTGVSLPVLPACPGIESPNELKDFTAPDAVYFTLYFRDLISGQVIAHEVFNPDGTLNRAWNETFTSAPWYSVAWWVWGQNYPAGSPSGTYKWVATYAGHTYEYLFNIGAAPAGSVPATPDEGTPLTVGKTDAGGVTLSWGESCRSSDSDFAVHEGTLDASPATPFYNHRKKVCSTGGETTWTFGSPPAGDLYWLVVPRSATRVGSFGTDSADNERPQPMAVLQRCVNQQFACDWP